MLNPQDRVIMVSGANRGIGRAIARCLHGKGYRLSLGIRDATAMQAAKDSFDAGRVMIHRHEARDRALNEAWVAGTIALRAARRLGQRRRDPVAGRNRGG